MLPTSKILTGKIRHKFIMEWIKRGGRKYMDKEEFVKKACHSTGIQYSPPPKIEERQTKKIP